MGIFQSVMLGSTVIFADIFVANLMVVFIVCQLLIFDIKHLMNRYSHVVSGELGKIM